MSVKADSQKRILRIVSGYLKSALEQRGTITTANQEAAANMIAHGLNESFISLLPGAPIDELFAAIETPAPERVIVCDKTCYPDKKAVLGAINQRTKGYQRRRPDHLRAYWCDLCQGWHLTHKVDRFA